jgi:hypothetical protein
VRIQEARNVTFFRLARYRDCIKEKDLGSEMKGKEESQSMVVVGR